MFGSAVAAAAQRIGALTTEYCGDSRRRARKGTSSAPTPCRRRGVKSDCVQWCSGELSARAVLSSHDASRVADTGCADQAAYDDESAGDPDT
jgi:hypothetical protein